MLVIGIMVVLAGVAVPMIDRLYGDMRLEAAGDQIRARWSEARSRAMTESRPYRFAVQPGTGAFRVAPARAEFWPGSDLPPAVGDTDPNQLPFQVEQMLPDGIIFELAPDTISTSEASADGWVGMVTFMPDGTCLEDVTIQVGSQGFRPVVLRLRGLTGSVSVDRGVTAEAFR